MATASRQSGGAQRSRGVVFGPSDSGALLTFVGSRWRLWLEAAGDRAQEVVHSDPAESYTAACWGIDGDEDGRTNSKNLAALGQCFALGCASGHVQVWDARSGELAGPTAQAFGPLVKGADAKVTALALASQRRGSVFAGCVALPEVLEVGIADGLTRASFKVGKVGIAQLSIGLGGTSEWLLSGCPNSALRLWSLQDAPKKKGAPTPPPVQQLRLAGPADTATCLDVLPASGNQLLALCADGTMQVDVYLSDASADAAKAPPLSSAFVLSAHEPIRAARFVRSGVAEGKATIIGWGPSVVVCWTVNLARAGRNGTPRTVASQFAVLSSELGGRMLSARPASELGEKTSPFVIAFGAASNPTFAKLRAPATKGGTALVERSAEVAAEATPAAAVKPGSEAAGVAAAAARKTVPTILGPLEAVVKRQQPQKRSAEDEKDGGATEARKRAKLATLPTLEKAQGGLSVTPMVRQSLRAKDATAMEQVLNQVTDAKIIDCTVSELSGAEAFDLMQECTHRIMSQPIRGPILCRWIQRVVLRHGAFLFSQPVLHRALQPLHDVFQARTASFKNLVRLQGRLKTLHYCGKSLVDQNTATKGTEDIKQVPLRVYCEGEEEAQDEEDEDGEGEGASSGDGDEDGLELDDLMLDDSDDDDILIDGF